LREQPFAFVHDARFEPASNGPLYRRDRFQLPYQSVVVDAVEALFDVGVRHEFGFQAYRVEDRL
jgi:hypothetical protein